MIKVGITGGIGSGKSTLCRLLSRRGAPLYLADDEAKRLMQEDPALRKALVEAFGAECYTEEGLNRPWLAQRVFGNPEELKRLNSLVHPAVMADFARWAEAERGKGSPYVVFESAILFSAGLERSVDRTVAVLAPEALRLERTCRRDGAYPEAVKRRMVAQMGDDELAARADITVVNILEEELQESAERLDKMFRYEAARA